MTSPCFSNSKTETTAPKTILANRIILSKGYMEVRHIILQGSNGDIGEAIGKIAQEWLKIVPLDYSEPIYAVARKMYMLDNYPLLLDRMIGVGRAYNVSYAHSLLDLSTLPYDIGPYGCSAVCFPPGEVKSRHPQVVRNFDSFIAPIHDVTGTPPAADARNLFSRNFVMELYPEVGYSSIVFGAMDLLNGVFDGLNSTGLTVCCMEANETLVNYNIPLGGGKTTGLYMFQLARLILDTCSNVDEAKVKILNAKISKNFSGLHMLIADTTGKSFIFELSQGGDEIHFIDNGGKPQILTNFPVVQYNDTDKFPSIVKKKMDNPFHRYDVLDKVIKSKKGQFSQKEIWKLMNRVYVRTGKIPPGLKQAVPQRTLWKILIDQKALSCKIVYYVNDGKKNKKTGKRNIKFSKPFTFNLGLLKEAPQNTSASNI